MVRRCEVCKRQFEPGDPNTSFHRFPQDGKLLEIWKNIIGKHNVSKDARICSNHFNISDIIFSPGGKRLLKRGAKPVLHHEETSDILEEVMDKSTPEEFQQDEQPLFKRPRLEPPHGSPKAGSSTATSPGMKHKSLHDTSDVCVEEIYGDTESSLLYCAVGEPSTSLIGKNPRKDLLLDSPRSDSTTITASNSSANFDSPKSTITATGSTTETASETELILSLLSGEELSRRARSIIPKRNVVDSKVRSGIRGNKKPKRRYFGDCETDDMNSPGEAKRNWQIAKRTVRMQKRKIRNLQQAKRRLKAKVYSLHSLMNFLKKKFSITENAENAIEASLSGTSSGIFKRMLKGQTRQKFTPELRAFALTLSFYSTKAYDYVRETFNKSLPHTSTITKWYRCINGGPGFSEEALRAVKLKVAELAEKNQRVLCNLVMDEMSIMKRTEWKLESTCWLLTCKWDEWFRKS